MVDENSPPAHHEPETQGDNPPQPQDGEAPITLQMWPTPTDPGNLHKAVDSYELPHGVQLAQRGIVLPQQDRAPAPLEPSPIEAYAQDHDVVEFLDTLAILANNTPEDLEAMLRSGAARMVDEERAAAAAKQEQEEEEEEEESESEEEESEDESEDELSDLDRVQLDLLAAVASLATKSQLSNTTKMILVKLISTKDKRLVAAHAV